MQPRDRPCHTHQPAVCTRCTTQHVLYWCRLHLRFRLMGGLQAKSMTSQRYRAVTRWRICVTMATLWRQQQDGGYALLFYIFNSTVIDWTFFLSYQTQSVPSISPPSTVGLSLRKPAFAGTSHQTCRAHGEATPSIWGELSYLAPLCSENISAPYFKQRFFRGGGITPQTVKHHASQSQDRNNKYFILYIEFCVNNKI